MSRFIYAVCFVSCWENGRNLFLSHSLFLSEFSIITPSSETPFYVWFGTVWLSSWARANSHFLRKYSEWNDNNVVDLEFIGVCQFGRPLWLSTEELFSWRQGKVCFIYWRKSGWTELHSSRCSSGKSHRSVLKQWWLNSQSIERNFKVFSFEAVFNSLWW